MSKGPWFEVIEDGYLGFKKEDVISPSLISQFGPSEYKGMMLNRIIRILWGAEKKGKLKKREAPEVEMSKANPNSKFKPTQDYEDKTNIPEESLDLLKDSNLFNKITEGEFDKKIEGELETRKVIFLCAAGGRLVENCQIASFNLLVNDEAGAGKDYVVNAVLSMIPSESYVHKTRISPTAFTYWHNSKFEPGWTWDGKVFYVEDISENVLNSDVIKVMTSKGSSATIVINQIATDIEIKGKPIFITTTASAIPSFETIRRFPILNLDSSEDQTKAIMRRHSQFSKEGDIPEYDEKYKEAQKYLERVRVRILYADLIDPHFPTKNMVMRTNYPRFLDYIKASASFHQLQRKTDEEGYILAEGNDYDLARECFLKLCSNKYMISLTINQKRILEVFEKEPELKKPVSHLHSDKMNFMSLRALMTNMGILVKYGMLETEIEKDSLNRDVETYSLAKSYNPNERLEIPTYEQICRNTSVTTPSTLTTITSTSSITPEGVVTEDVEDAEVLNRPTDRLKWDEKALTWQLCAYPHGDSMCGNSPCNEFEDMYYCKEHFIKAQKKDV